MKSLIGRVTFSHREKAKIKTMGPVLKAPYPALHIDLCAYTLTHTPLTKYRSRIIV